jgi:hypothetical protein
VGEGAGGSLVGPFAAGAAASRSFSGVFKLAQCQEADLRSA